MKNYIIAGIILYIVSVGVVYFQAKQEVYENAEFTTKTIMYTYKEVTTAFMEAKIAQLKAHKNDKRRICKEASNMLKTIEKQFNHLRFTQKDVAIKIQTFLDLQNIDDENVKKFLDSKQKEAFYKEDGKLVFASLDSHYQIEKQNITKQNGVFICSYPLDWDMYLATKRTIIVSLIFLLLIATYGVLLRIFCLKIGTKNEKIDKLAQDLEQAQKSLEDNKKILAFQTKLASIGEMSLVATHKWKQPLSVMQVLTTNFQESFNSNTTKADVKKYTQQILDSTDTLKFYINDFLNTFNTKDEPEKFNLRLLIEKIVEFLAVWLDKAEIKTNIMCDNFFVTSNKSTIEQILMILISNAKDALSASNAESKQIEINAVKNQAEIIIDIRDNGTGIEPKNLDKIFDFYFSTKDKHGKGIGLYAAKIMAANINATLEAKNEQQGACFTLRINTQKDAL